MKARRCSESSIFVANEYFSENEIDFDLITMIYL